MAKINMSNNLLFQITVGALMLRMLKLILLIHGMEKPTITNGLLKLPLMIIMIGMPITKEWTKVRQIVNRIYTISFIFMSEVGEN